MMTPEQIKQRFPRASKSFLDANAQEPAADNIIQHPERVKQIRSSKAPNKTEAEYGRILESMKKRGEIIRYEYQGITLRWLDMRYTPDWFVVWKRHVLAVEKTPMTYSEVLARNKIANVEFEEIPYFSFKAIEVKGPHIHYEQQAKARFKGARGLWPEIQFEMWQKKSGQWNRIM